MITSFLMFALQGGASRLAKNILSQPCRHVLFAGVEKIARFKYILYCEHLLYLLPPPLRLP